MYIATRQGGWAVVALTLVLATGHAWAAPKTWVGGATGTWATDSNWSGAAAPAGGDDVVLTNAGVTVTLDTSTPYLGSFAISNTATLVFTNWSTLLSATNVLVGASGKITAAGPFFDTTMSNRVNIACQGLTVAMNGSIDVGAKGYAGGRFPNDDQRFAHGPGKGSGEYMGAGGSHGGVGGGSHSTAYTLLGKMPSYNRPYGEPDMPLAPGSGGGRGVNPGYLGGMGGGAVWIDASNGTVTINGTISANGGTGAGTGGGGSGGAVHIACRTIAGTSGIVQANGGSFAGNHLGYGGSGAGGRIAVKYDTAHQSLVPDIRFSVEPGPLSYYRGQPEPGTLWFPNTLFVAETITKLSGRLVIPGFNAWAPSSLTVSNCWVRFGTNTFELSVASDLKVQGTDGNYGGRLDVGGWGYGAGVAVPYHRGTCATTAVLTVGGSLVLDGGDLAVYSGPLFSGGSDYGSLVQVDGDMILTNGSWVYPWSVLGTDSGIHRGSPLFTMRNLQVAGNAGFDADGKGFAGNKDTSGFGPGFGNWAHQGGTYGGRGANTNFNTTVPYDTLEEPRGPGSSGYAPNGYVVSGNGGGTVRIEATGNVTLDGTLSARGSIPQAYAAGGPSGGGSGGAIYVSCRRFTAGASAIVRADGGNGFLYSNPDRSGGGGGGGRIAVWSKSLARHPSNTVSVAGGVGTGVDPNTQTAEPGTIYWGQYPFDGTLIMLR
ncbi:MAG: G8 domain-containing protein [Kiritimatiellae bacterium]|nr:G8 domain-containing protein [Kiritimatiellia bacterium]